MRLLIGTKNKGKVREYQQLLADLNIEIIGLSDIGLTDLEVEESGNSFEENAALKARAYAKAANIFALADDSGLVVDALDGRPGLYSARYGEPELDDAGRRLRLLSELKGISHEARAARFICAIAVANPETDEIITATGACEGHILHAERDQGRGFGYDAIFQPSGYQQSFAEIPSQEKNRISHRAIAARNIIPLLQDFLSAK